MSDTNTQILLLVVAIICVVLWLYVSGALITGDRSVSGWYVARIFLVAIITVIAAPLFQIIADALYIAHLGPTLSFIVIVYAVKHLMMPELVSTREWEHSLWISFFCLVLIYAFNSLSDSIFGTVIINQYPV